MVCLGNICRSPLAQGILEDLAYKNKLTLHVDSCGTSGWHVGNAPDQRSIEIAEKHHIDINSQRARKFNTNDFKCFDKIYVMDKGMVVDSGNHEELLNKSETYKNYYNKQINKS